MQTIEKKFHFDAGHRLIGFNTEKESTLHGHTWYLNIVIETQQKLNEYKTILDTNNITTVIKPIIQHVDHSFIIWDKDPIAQDLKKLCKKHTLQKLLLVNFNPTLEGIAEYLYNEINNQFEDLPIQIYKVDLHCSKSLKTTYRP